MMATPASCRLRLRTAASVGLWGAGSGVEASEPAERRARLRGESQGESERVLPAKESAGDPAPRVLPRHRLEHLNITTHSHLRAAPLR